VRAGTPVGGGEGRIPDSGVGRTGGFRSRPALRQGILAVDFCLAAVGSASPQGPFHDSGRAGRWIEFPRRPRKADTRRKILLGAIVLAKVEQGEFAQDRLRAWLDGALTRPDDRALFRFD
jgi:hypothetical protein